MLFSCHKSLEKEHATATEPNLHLYANLSFGVRYNTFLARIIENTFSKIFLALVLGSTTCLEQRPNDFQATKWVFSS